MAEQRQPHTSVLPHNHGGNFQEVLQKMPPEREFDKASGIFQQLCDSTRLRILWLLCHSEECVYNLSAAIGMSSPAVSHHLRTLKQTGLVSSRRDGKEVYYKLADTKEAQLVHQMIDDVFEMNCPNNSIR